MKLVWEYELPAREQPSDHDYEGPIHVGTEAVFFATQRFEYPTEIRARDRSRRGSVVTLHSLEFDSGKGTRHDLNLASCLLPGKWAFIGHDNRLLLHCGPLLTVTPRSAVTAFPFTEPQPIKTASRPRFLRVNDKITFADAKNSRLYAFDTVTNKSRWELDLKSVKPYAVGAPLPFGNEIACYGRDALTFVDTITGNIRASIRISRIDKLFSPIPMEDDLLLGYTNWSVGGVVRYCPSSEKVVWQYRKQFSGPATYCKIHLLGNTVVWVKGETEIIGIDVDSGREQWAYAASPWLYTEIVISNGDLIFGTAGRDGYIQALDGATGQARWSVFLKNGCAFFGRHRDSVIVGDSDCLLRRLRLSDGKEIDRLKVDGQVVGDVTVSGTLLYTVVWFSRDSRPPRLICVELE